MTPDELRQKYFDFFTKRGHAQIPSAPLVPQDDPTTLFTSSGMQPLINYFLGEKHPLGKRVVDSQKCFRSVDIEEVGDNCHTTFFEMLGNWSFGDYFKIQQIPWVFEFLTRELGLDPGRLYITVFRGREDLGIPKDGEAVKIWQDVYSQVNIDAKAIDLAEKRGMQDGRIFYYDEHDNWWTRSGLPQDMPVGEPGGPSSEVFFDFGADLKLHENSPHRDQPCHPNCNCGRFLEIGNSVFMTYQKTKSGFTPLKDKNIDFGGGFERILAAINNNPDIFTTDLYTSMIRIVESISDHQYSNPQFTTSFRIIADHVKAATMLAADGVYPSNKEQGYFSRRLLRRAIRHGYMLGIEKNFVADLVPAVAEIYKNPYPEVSKQQSDTSQGFTEEENKFRKTLATGLKQFQKSVAGWGTSTWGSSQWGGGSSINISRLTAEKAFQLYETYGFPLELSIEEAQGKEIKIEENIQKKFEEEKKKHSDQSRTASAGKFKGGLADHSEVVTKLHTATHLLHAALRNVLGDHVRQEGSNITAERLRFDFSHPEKLTDEQIKQIEAEINQRIKEDLPVIKTVEGCDQALKSGALAFFKEKYPDKVSVYTIGDPNSFYSKELCGGPHVSSTGQIGTVTIKKQENIGAGKRRIYAVLVNN